MAEYQTLVITEHTVSDDGKIVEIVINRPDRWNALSDVVLNELTHAVRAPFRTDRPRAALITGAGDRAFAAGADISEMSGMSCAEAKALSEKGQRLMALIEEAPYPFIAVVNGVALGGGLELALACDFIYAADKARFGQPEANLAIMPGFGGTQRLARRVGLGLARELIYTGNPISAERALAAGLVNAVFPAEDLRERALDAAKQIASKGELAVAASKRVMLRGLEMDLFAACELEAHAFALLFCSEDQKEGMRAFLERRAPAFRGI